MRSVDREETAPTKGRFVAPADLQLLTVEQVLDMLGISRTAFYELRRSGQFPKPVHLGSQRLRWRVSDVRAWLDKGGSPPVEKQPEKAD